MQPADIEQFLYREARLLDELRLQEWLTLFTADGVYWVPLDDSLPRNATVSIIHDDALRREERVHRALNVDYASQSPRSRTVHFINNVMVDRVTDEIVDVRSNQLIYELRTGDFRQVGLGQLRPIVATVDHRLVVSGGVPKIALKKILLLDRNAALGNLSFIF
jgi:3-phenylpropionate/cinnamic acid dioxygenase small subunit